MASERKTFTVEHEINSSARDVYFSVDPTESNKEIIESISKKPGGRVIGLHGSRSSGKSTRVTHLVEQLSETFFCISISLDLEVTTEDYHTFWKSFGKKIERGYPKLPR